MTAVDRDKQEIRRIYAIGSALGILERGSHDDDLHGLVWMLTGKESISALTGPERRTVIAELERRQGSSPPSHAGRKRQYTERPGGATEGQQRKVWALMYQLQARDAEPSAASLRERLCRIIRKELKVDAGLKDPFAWLDYRACSKLIEILKNYVAHAGGEAGDGP